MAASITYAALVLVLISGPIMGQPTTNSLFDQAITITGRFGEAAFVVELNDPLNTPFVDLDVRYSSILSLDESHVTVLVNDIPDQTIRLKDLGTQLRIPLPRQSGFHRVVIQTKLAVDDDPCLLEHRDAAWLRILETSNLRVRSRRPSTSGVAALTVADLPMAWAEARRVELVGPANGNLATNLAMVDFDHLLRGWGKIPAYEKDSTDARVLVGLLNEVGYMTSLERELEQHADLRAVMDLRGSTLRILGRRPEDLSMAAALLRDDRARTLCTEAVCKVGPSFELVDPVARDKESVNVLTLESIGYPKGWTAKGDGTSTLRFVWQRPVWWSLLRWPELKLQLRLSRIANWREDMPAVSMRVNGQPIASYSLDKTSGNLVNVTARIPSQFWEDDVWAIEIDAHLMEDYEHCTASDPDQNWMVVEPVSGLWVPRKELKFGGIADFYTEIESPPMLAGDDSLLAQHRPAIAALLYPYRPRLSGSFEWDADCTSNCLVLKENEQLNLPDEIRLADGPHVVDREGGLRIPILKTERTYQLVRDGLQLYFGVPTSPDQVVVPDYLALRSTLALHHDAFWNSVAPADTAIAYHQVGESAGPPEGASSEEAAKLGLIQLLWSLALIAMLCVAAFWLWRGYRLYKRREEEEIEYFGKKAGH